MADENTPERVSREVSSGANSHDDAHQSATTATAAPVAVSIDQFQEFAETMKAQMEALKGSLPKRRVTADDAESRPSSEKRARMVENVSEDTEEACEIEYDEYDEEQNEDGWCTDEDDSEGPPIIASISKYVDARFTKELNLEKVKEKIERYPPPSNTAYLKECRINQSIYDKISLGAKKRDGRLKKIQSLIARGATAACKVAEFIFERNKESKEIVDKTYYDAAFDAITFMGQASYHLNMRRVSCNKFKCVILYDIFKKRWPGYIILIIK